MLRGAFLVGLNNILYVNFQGQFTNSTLPKASERISLSRTGLQLNTHFNTLELIFR
jgi:hypothetical protein